MESIVITELSTEKETHNCNCGAENSSEFPVLDATLIPHALRHAAILGSLDSLHIGSGMILLAPHKPLPLLAQIEDRFPGAFEITFLQQGPDIWHVQFVRNM